MPISKKPPYPKEIKLKAVTEVLLKNRTLKDVAQELNIIPATIANWISIYKADNSAYNQNQIPSKYNQKPTLRQTRFADLMLNGAKSMKEAALKAGYAENTTTDPSRNIMDKPGAIMAMAEALGEKRWVDLVKSGLIKRLESDKDYSFLKSAELWARLSGAFAPEKHEVKATAQDARKQSYSEIVAMVRKEQENKEKPTEDPQGKEILVNLIESTEDKE